MDPATNSLTGRFAPPRDAGVPRDALEIKLTGGGFVARRCDSVPGSADFPEEGTGGCHPPALMPCPLTGLLLGVPSGSVSSRKILTILGLAVS